MAIRSFSERALGLDALDTRSTFGVRSRRAPGATRKNAGRSRTAEKQASGAGGSSSHQHATAAIHLQRPPAEQMKKGEAEHHSGDTDYLLRRGGGPLFELRCYTFIY
mmetsp:Transcript_22783/g.47330  ORF Transcript_22783/g.47330 Transcript_22783/m.47330 type:complete len:107 (-) Transcript_22783:1560-1880(-)